MAAPREIWKQKYAILKFVFLYYRNSSGKKNKTKVIANIISCDLKWFFGRSEGSDFTNTGNGERGTGNGSLGTSLQR